MAEAFLQVVLENLSSLIKEEIGLILGVDEELKKLCSTLTTIQAVLEDAELNQTDNLHIRDWLCKLNRLVYEIDDILDECNTHFSKLKHFGGKFSCYSLNHFLQRHQIGKKIKKVTQDLDSVAAERSKFHLREMPLDRPREVAISRETGSLLNEPDQICGRDEDREKIVKMLVEDAREKKELSVLPIVGVGGLGKTTLAQLVFNDPRVKEHFEERIWVCVSDNFEVKTLVKAMIESVSRSTKDAELQQLDSLQRCLFELLSQKRYLIVLDDVWNDEQEKWYELKHILSCGSTGASIIVTTRLNKVVNIMGTLAPHHLKGLSDDHCWMLLKKRAFRLEEEEKYPHLEVIGREIVRKCGGVPLAAQALGGVLRFQRREEEWNNVKESEIWKLSPADTLIMPTLRLSYHHLPLELRQCFAYFAAFPKDYSVERESLILLWMAHGFISSKGKLQAEEVGNEICNELILRSLFQLTSSEEIGMHDLVHDLAQSVMESKVPGIQIERNIASASTIRQLNLRDKCLLFPKTFQQDFDISSISDLTSLRVLDASWSLIKELPPSIGNLIHLRQLNLSSTSIRTLPNSVCTLWNLQLLNLDYCTRLVALPSNLRYLRNLQHLCLLDSGLSEMPSKIRELTLLKTLSKFVVGLSRGNRLEELQCLNLGGSLEIRHLERVKGYMDAKKANISEKKNLEGLGLFWERNSLSKLDEDVDAKVLEALEPHSNLKYLLINGFSGRSFPPWMGNSTLGKLVDIDIVDCNNLRCLPEVGELPNLKKLGLWNVGIEYIIEDEEVRSGNQVMVYFPNLEELSLCGLPNLMALDKKQERKESAFPNMKRLKMVSCSSLGMVSALSYFKRLEKVECSSATLASFSGVDIFLEELKVNIEEETTCFPIETLAKFTDLRSMTIVGAKEMSVPGEGLDAFKKLQSLIIVNCKSMTSFPKGLLSNLASLQRLYIMSCDELVEVPDDEIKHLCNLEDIWFRDLPKLACLPHQALQDIASLRRLWLLKLPELQYLPDGLHHLTSLYVLYCPKVASIPAAFSNLILLSVLGCPQLQRRCLKGTGEDWHKISHIPNLEIAKE